MPFLHRRGGDFSLALKTSAKGSSGAKHTHRLRTSLVISEVALSAVLLVGAGLMVRSLSELMHVKTGVRTEGILAASVQRYLPNVNDEQGLVGYCDQFRRMADRIASLPGVLAVSGATDLPYLRGHEQRERFEIYTRARSTTETAYKGPAEGADVMPGYFETMAIPFLEGRDFTEADRVGKMPVVIISRRAAEMLFPGQSPIGQQVRWGNYTTIDPWVTVIGVVENVHWHPAETDQGLEFYWPYRQYPGPEMTLVVRTDTPFGSLGQSIRQALNEVNPDFAISRVKPMRTIVTESVWQRRVWAFLLAFFAGAALILAVIGIYGTMSYLVTRRRQEIGIRMAIGATPGRVLRWVLGEGARMVVAGGLLGIVGSMAVGYALRKMLFGITQFDSTTYVAAVALLGFVALVASAAPAWRAATVLPVVALRED
jgi:putative ABC transport system permease protein